MGVVVLGGEVLGDPLLEPFDDLLERLLLRLQRGDHAVVDVDHVELGLELGGQVEEVVFFVENRLGVGRRRLGGFFSGAGATSSSQLMPVSSSGSREPAAPPAHAAPGV